MISEAAMRSTNAPHLLLFIVGLSGDRVNIVVDYAILRPVINYIIMITVMCVLEVINLWILHQICPEKTNSWEGEHISGLGTVSTGSLTRGGWQFNLLAWQDASKSCTTKVPIWCPPWYYVPKIALHKIAACLVSKFIWQRRNRPMIIIVQCITIIDVHMC